MTATRTAPGDERLFEPGASASFGPYLKNLWSRRHYMAAEAGGRLSADHSENRLGRLWLFIEPTLFIAVYFLVFDILIDASRGLEGTDFLAFLAVGKILYGMMRRAITGATSSLTGDKGFRAMVSMPVAVYPTTAWLKAVLAYRAELVIMMLFVLLRGTEARWSWLLILPISLLAMGLALGIGFLLARAVSRFADLRSALPQVMRLGMYSSGVIFPIEQYVLATENGEFWLKVIAINPFYAIIKSAQWAVLGYEAPMAHWIVPSAVIWGLLLPWIGLVAFIRGERRYSSAIYEG